MNKNRNKQYQLNVIDKRKMRNSKYRNENPVNVSTYDKMKQKKNNLTISGEEKRWEADEMVEEKYVAYELKYPKV